MNNTEVFKPDKFNFAENYRAKVVDNIDPLKAGRIRVRVFGVHSQSEIDVPNDTLPWAIPATPINGGLKDVGTFMVPKVDSHVFIFFDAGNHNFPVYFATAPAMQSDEPDWHVDTREATTDTQETVETAGGGSWTIPTDMAEPTYPQKNVIAFSDGQKVTIDESASAMTYEHPTGTILEISSDGSVQVYSSQDANVYGNNVNITGATNVNVKSSSDVNVESAGNIAMQSDGDLEIEASNIRITTSGNMERDVGGVDSTQAGTITHN